MAQRLLLPSDMTGSQRGFTLLELLVTMAILGILSAAAVQAFSTYRRTAQEAVAITYMRNWVPAQELYLQTYNHYADADEELASSGFRVLKVPTNVPYNFSIDSPSTATSKWWGRATPTESGYRYFYIDSTGVVISSHQAIPGP